jgi:hypothetical protein
MNPEILAENDALSKDQTIWKGSNIRQLSQDFPPSTVPGADPFEAEYLNGTMLLWHFEFHRLEGGKWVPSSDPRVRLSEELTTLEQQMEALNSRLFPERAAKNGSKNRATQSFDSEFEAPIVLTPDQLVEMQEQNRERFLEHWRKLQAEEFAQLMINWLSFHHYSRSR